MAPELDRALDDFATRAAIPRPTSEKIRNPLQKRDGKLRNAGRYCIGVLEDVFEHRSMRWWRFDGVERVVGLGAVRVWAFPRCHPRTGLSKRTIISV